MPQKNKSSHIKNHAQFISLKPKIIHRCIKLGIICMFGISINSTAMAFEFSDVAVSGSVLAVQQTVNGAAVATGEDTNEFNTRIDLEFEYPFDDEQSKVFAHVRSGLGAGVQLANGTFSSTPNTTVFAGEDQNIHHNHTTLFQLWLQSSRSLTETLSWRATLGQIDPPSFFDDNAFAHDESEAFMNNLFVHNPLLDSGGSYGVDELGSAPGGVFELIKTLSGDATVRASVGVFGRGNGTEQHKGLSNPSHIAQIHFDNFDFLGNRSGLAVYTWRNPALANANDGSLETQTGWGTSFDHDLTDQLGVFARYGHGVKGLRSFDRATTVGTHVKGALWGREEDHIGIALASIKPEFSNLTDPKNERTYEFYYSMPIYESLELTFNAQHVSKPSGDDSLPSHKHYGVRLKWSF